MSKPHCCDEPTTCSFPTKVIPQITEVEAILTVANKMERNGGWHCHTILNCRTKSASGGAGIFVKVNILRDFNVALMDTSTE